MQRAVTLANGRRVSLGCYVAAWRQAREAEPETMFRHGPATWWPVTAADALAQFRDGLNDRINRHAPHYGRGRKWSNDWQRQALQLAGAVNTPRLVVRWAPVEFRARLAHRLATD